jgi:geranylgeranyl diphosphate synthase type I
MDTKNLVKEMQKSIDLQLREVVSTLLSDYPLEFVKIINYQFGWNGIKTGEKVQGKRIRPLLVLLTCEACGGVWRNALPAAAAVELVHNFSLIHDDIQDHSSTRRGRETIWVKWGEAQAINTGDAMLTLAHLSLLKLAEKFNSSQTLKAENLLQSACLNLTRGQYLDLAFEKKDELPLDYYWKMVEGKTSSLLAVSLTLGALLAGEDEEKQKKFYDLGIMIGFAFQVQDDWLGIWGEKSITGKSTESDLITRKITYPVLLGIQKKREFAHYWIGGKEISAKKAKELASLLQTDGAAEETQTKFSELYQNCLEKFDDLLSDRKTFNPLKDVLTGLLNRMN